MINFYENKHFLNPKYPFRFTKIFPEKMTKQFEYRERIKHCFIILIFQSSTFCSLGLLTIIDKKLPRKKHELKF